MKKRFLQIPVKLMIVSLFTIFLFGSCWSAYLYSNKLADSQDDENEEVVVTEEQVNQQ